MTEERSAETFDVIVIGAGAVGENVADRAVKGGLSALLIESELVGGECSYWACMPSKALIRPATALKAAQSLAGSREAVSGKIDADAVLKRRNSFTADWHDDGQVAWVDGAGIKFIRGKARLTGKLSVDISAPDAGVQSVQARYAVVLATGSQPTLPPFTGLKDIEFWGTREATSSQRVPESLIVIGGGVAGAELAQAYARLGAKVTQLVRSGLLNVAPAEARQLVRQAFQQDGIDLRENTSPRSVSRDSDGVHVELDGETIHAEELLVATGRAPALADVGLEGLNLQAYDPAKSHLSTDESGRVDGTDWLYAVGDAAGKVLLTHQGKYEARITGDAIAARAKGPVESKRWSKFAQTADELAVPSVIFTDPEVALVGRNVAQANSDGVRVTEVSLPIAVAGSSLYADDYQGWAQLVIDAEREVIIGATFAGPDVAELLHSATIAIVGEVPLSRLWHAVPSYPTISEVWLRLLEKLGL
ncbi:mercuric reductase [Renibacterium salmoninarum ATCC 33209]|uniref:Mercuric reductase n=1 Tax=Renibacterium salmoninarum (strain ATCC 33209 / DSM 20767 / JCM 11484 / NBRC 15589 / NCIMB 2235) TaxID=288705 RepID=A9WL82_RENSM|nr:NAD(P)/FAD-dependent oxidoreductase [Renibacterium salmoninarum]ABY21796.1 mercuric reductase [Renibacterium salmoninarum ATCC 33209]